MWLQPTKSHRQKIQCAEGASHALHSPKQKQPNTQGPLVQCETTEDVLVSVYEELCFV